VVVTVEWEEHRNMLADGNGGMAERRGVAPAFSGYGKARRLRLHLRGGPTDLPRWVGAMGTAPVSLVACTVARRRVCGGAHVALRSVEVA